MKALNADSLLARILTWATGIICRRPGWFFWPQVIVFALSVICVVPKPYGLGLLDFDMNRDHLVSSKEKYHQSYLRLQKEFPLPDFLITVVQSSDIERNRQFVERLAAKLQAETNLFHDVFYQQSLTMLGSKALLFVPETNLVEMKDMFRAAGPFIRQFTETTNLVSFFEEINRAILNSPQEENDDTRSLVKSLPALTRIISQATDALQRPGIPPSPNVIALFGESESDVLSNYITFDNGRIFLVTTRALNDDLTTDAVDRLRVLVRQTQAEVPGLNIGVTGGSVLDYDEMIQSQKDTTKASIVSLVLCMLIFIYGYNETGRPVKAVICLLVGLAYTLAFTALTIHHLNILTITFVPMLIGLAIDFGVHLITRYEEELRHGRTEVEAMSKAMVYTGQGIFTGALTTAGAFLAMAFTHFQGIQEMGLICGGGLVLCLLPMMTMLPALLMRGRQNVMDRHATEDATRARIENIWLQRPVVVMGITAALCVASLFAARRVQFDYNLLKMQSPTLPSVMFAKKLLDSADKSLIFGADMADSLPDAVALRDKYLKLTNVVADVDPPFYNDMLLDQRGKLKLVGEIKRQIASFQFRPADARPVVISNLTLTLYGLSGYLGNVLVRVTNEPALTANLVALRQAIEDLRKAALKGNDYEQAEHGRKLALFQQALFTDLRDTFDLLQRQDNSGPLRVPDLPPSLHDQFVGVTGKLLLQVYPKYNVWERTNQEAFVAALRTVNPDVTGAPVEYLEYETLLKDSYVQAAWYSLAAIAILVFIHFRSLTAVILALLPVAIGTLWLAGLMGVLGISINLANIMTLPLVIGIGVTNGIHILNRFAEERTPGILSRSTGKAVLVSGLTALAGFGSLILAKHQGIYSLGCLMATGIGTCMIAALTFLPALLNLLGRWRPLIKQPSGDNARSTLGREEPR